MDATCSWLRGAWERLSCVPKLAISSAELGVAQQEYRASQGQMLLVWILRTFEAFWESLQYELKRAICIKKLLEVACMGLQVGWSGALRNHQDRGNNVSQVDRDSDLVPTCV